MNKKLIVLLSTLLCVALTIIGGFHLYAIKKEAAYSATALPYLKQVIPELSKWEPEIARQYMSTEFLQTISAERFASVIKAMSKVGELQELGEPEFDEIYSGDTPAGEKQTVISYKIKGRYTTGEALITMSLLDRDGVLEVYRFNVQSDALGR